MKNAKRLPKRICESTDCIHKFHPRVRTQRFCSQTCKNREAQRRFRK